MKERRKTKQNSWKKKKTALTSTWKNLPLEATKKQQKIEIKKTIQEKKKEKKLKVTNINQSLSKTRKSWSKTLQKLEDRKAT